MVDGVALDREGDDRRAELAGSGRHLIVPAAGGAVSLQRVLQADEDEDGGTGAKARAFWLLILKRKWLLLAALIAGIAGAMILTIFTTPLYRATARLEIAAQEPTIVETGNIQRVSMGDPLFLATQVGLLRSRALAERVARDGRLIANPALAPQALPRERRAQIATGRLAGGFIVTPIVGSRLIDISFVSPSADLAAQVTNSFAENFITANLERKFEATAYARQFLQRRLAQTKTALEKSERDLVAYAQREGLVSVPGSTTEAGGAGTGQSTVEAASLAAINASLSEATNARIVAEQRYRQALANGSSSELLNNGTAQSLSQQRGQLQATYQEKLSTLKPDFPDMVELKAKITEIDRQIARQLGSINNAMLADYKAAQVRENALAAKVRQLQSSILNLRGRSIQYTILQREVDTNRTIYDDLLQRSKQVGVAGGVGSTLISVVDRAETPRAPFSPVLTINLIIGVFLGLGIGLVIAVGLEFVDDTIRSLDDLKEKVSLTPLGLIPLAPKGQAMADQLKDAQSPISEAYFSVRTAVTFAAAGGTPRSLLITSSRPSEGKSSSSYSLAQSFARLGYRTLLIDADMRKPSFKIDDDQQRGLSAVLASEIDPAAHLVKTNVANLTLLPSGPIPPNAAELLASERMLVVLRQLEQTFDIVIVDAPPVLGLADAPLLSSMCQATIMIVETGKIRRPTVQYSVNRLRSAGGHVIGGVLTKFNVKTAAYNYGYGYGYGYSAYAYAEDDSEKSKRRIEIGVS